MKTVLCVLIDPIQQEKSLVWSSSNTTICGSPDRDGEGARFREKREDGKWGHKDMNPTITSNCFNTQIGELRRITINFLGRSSKIYIAISIHPSISTCLSV